MFTNEYLKRVYADVERRDGHEPEFLQAVREVFESLELVIDKHPEWEKAGLIERFVEPERVVEFRVPGWTIRALPASTAASECSTIPL